MFPAVCLTLCNHKKAMTTPITWSKQNGSLNRSLNTKVKSSSSQYNNLILVE